MNPKDCQRQNGFQTPERPCSIWTLPPTCHLALAVHVAPQRSGLLGLLFQAGLSSPPRPSTGSGYLSPGDMPVQPESLLLLEEQPWGMRLHDMGVG